MQISNSNKLNFTSDIRLTTSKEFFKLVNQNAAKHVSAPWTIKESILAKNAYTTDVYDCTTCGITDGQSVFLMHLCPTISKNLNIKKIEECIKKHVDLSNKNLHGFILGSKANNINSSFSPILFDSFVKLIEKFKIPYSSFKGGDFKNHVAYFSNFDEWIVASDLLDNFEPETTKLLFSTPQGLSQKLFDNVKISNLDKLSW